jgi:hypothetical protein
MRTPVPDEVYVAAAYGHLSENEVVDLESFSRSLNKMASTFSEGMRYGLGTAAASAVGGLGMMGLSHGIQNAYDSMTFEKDLQATLKTRPELSTYPKEQVRLVYGSLRRLSPEIAKDPLTAGTYLVRQFERRNPSDPHSLPTVELESARTLTQITGELSKRRDNVRDALLQANAQGVQAGVGYMQESRQVARQAAQMETQYTNSLRMETEKNTLRTNENKRKEKKEDVVNKLKEQHGTALRNKQNTLDTLSGQYGTMQQQHQDAQNRANSLEMQNAALRAALNRGPRGPRPPGGGGRRR